MRGPSGRTGVGPRLCPAVSHRWLSGVRDGAADALWALGPGAPPPGERAKSQATLDAAAAAALRAGGQDGAAAPSGRREAPGGVRDLGGHRAGAFGMRLADQYGLCRAAQPHHPSACRRGRAPGQHVVQWRGGLTAAVGLVSLLRQFLLAPRELTSAVAPTGAHQRHGLRQAVAALYASDGGGTDGSRLDAARGAALSRAAVATASRGVSKSGGGKPPEKGA